jgi:hypothetical protein
MYKIKILVVAILMAVGINSLTYVPVEEKIIEAKVEYKMQELREESEGSKWLVERNYYMVQTEGNNWMHAKPLDLSVEGGMILEKKYKLGDIVEVTVDSEGDIVKEHKLTGEEFDYVSNYYTGRIDALMDEGIEKMNQQEGMVMAEDGTLVPASFYEKK